MYTFSVTLTILLTNVSAAAVFKKAFAVSWNSRSPGSSRIVMNSSLVVIVSQLVETSPSRKYIHRALHIIEITHILDYRGVNFRNFMFHHQNALQIGKAEKATEVAALAFWEEARFFAHFAHHVDSGVCNIRCMTVTVC